MSPGMAEELKRLGITTNDLLKIKSSGMGSHVNWKGKQVKKRTKKKKNSDIA